MQPKLLLNAIIALGFTTLPSSGQENPMSEDEARAVHERVLTIDSHIDIGPNYATALLDPGRFTLAQVDLPSMRAGGLDAGFFIVFTPQGPQTPEGYDKVREDANDKFRAIERMLQAYPDQATLATRADDVEAIAATGRRAVLIGMENAYPLGDSVDDVALWASRGIRYVGITHFGNNQFGSSSNPSVSRGDSDTDEGLTELGRELVAALNDHGIMVDISHVGKKTSLDAIEISRVPVIASHSGARAVYENARNLDDEQLLAIRDNGGVAQMVAYRSYVAALDPALVQAQNALRKEMGLTSYAAYMSADRAAIDKFVLTLRQLRNEHNDVSLQQFIDHVDYAVKLIGIDHVGLSGDFDGGGGVWGWDGAAESFNVTRELMQRGYSADDVAKLWGGNLLRVMRQVEEAAVHR